MEYNIPYPYIGRRKSVQPYELHRGSVVAFMLRSHNGVHCCGTVGDSHSHSQLSTAKCTFTGNSFQIAFAKIRLFFDITNIFFK